MVRDAFFEERSQLLETESIQRVSFVDDRFEVLDLGKAFKHHGELVSSDSTVVEENTIYDLVIEALASCGKTSTIAIAQQIILQTQSLLVDLIQYG